MDNIHLEIKELAQKLNNFTSYSFTTDFMGANSAWSVEIDASHYRVMNENGGSPLLLAKIQPGMSVRLYVNDTLTCTGYIDKVNVTSNRSGGTIMQISGRDALAPVIDACVDPKFSFSDTQTIVDVCRKILVPFGFTKVEPSSIKGTLKLTLKRTNLILNHDANHEISGFIRKTITSPMGSKCKPHSGEGVYQFLERIGKRFGFHVWADADGETVYLGQPDYSHEPFFSIQHAKYGETPFNNTIDGNMSVDMTKQPCAIVAEGHGGGGKFRKQTNKILMVNDFLYPSDTKELTAFKAAYHEAKVLPRRNIEKPKFITPPKYLKPFFEYDDASGNQAQLESFVRRKMAELQSQLFSARYTIQGHTQNGAIWATNALVRVDDYVNDIHQNLWIKSRTFTKDRSGGTKTTIECILPYSLQLVADEIIVSNDPKNSGRAAPVKPKPNKQFSTASLLDAIKLLK